MPAFDSIRKLSAALVALLVLLAQSPAFAQSKPAASWNPAHSNNYTVRSSRGIDMIVIHTVEGSYAGCIATFQNPNRQASAHYLVAFNGRVAQMVADKDIGWHAGNWSYNVRSIGIEHEGYAGQNLWTRTQYETSARLSAWLCRTYGIPVDRQHIIEHKQVPNQSHWDPGPSFDWNLYLNLIRGYLGGNNPPPPPPPPPPAPSYEAEFVGQSFPGTMKSGQEAIVWVEYRNKGSKSWDTSNTRLGTQDPQDRSSDFFKNGNWLGANRPTPCDKATGPGAVGRFTFIIKAPAVTQPRDWTEVWRPVQEGVTWFGPKASWKIRVEPNYDAELVQASGPAVLVSGEKALAFVEYRNKGNLAWDGNTRLGTDDPHDRSSDFFSAGDWISAGRPTAVDAGTAPGAVGRFSFELAAPVVAAPATYTERFAPVQEGVTWFGPRSEIQVRVYPQAPWVDKLALSPASIKLDQEVTISFDTIGALAGDPVVLVAGRAARRTAQNGGSWTYVYRATASAPEQDGKNTVEVRAAGTNGKTHGASADLTIRFDADSDGMADAWEKLYGLDPNKDDAADDWDGDGLTNLEEFQFNTNPKVSNGPGIIDATSDPAGAEVRLVPSASYPGRLLGRAGARGKPSTISNVPPGLHVLAFSQPEYLTVYRPVKVVAGRIAAVDASLPVLLSEAFAARAAVNQGGNPLVQSAGGSAPELADWNCDGTLDLLVGAADGSVTLYENRSAQGLDLAAGRKLAAGNGNLAVPPPAMPRVVDWDADGRKDLLVGAGDGSVWIFLNDGRDQAPALDAGRKLATGGAPFQAAGGGAAPVVLDWNGDGVKDLLVGDRGGNVHLLENKGSEAAPVFAAALPLGTDKGVLAEASAVRPLWADVNADGRDDLVLGTGAGTVVVYPNSGAAGRPVFYLRYRYELMLHYQGTSARLVAGGDAAPALADLDGDGRRELLLGNAAGELGLHGGHHLRGDVNDSRKVDGWDLVRVSWAFGSGAGSARYHPRLDVERDGTIDIKDVRAVIGSFGKTY